MPSLIEQKHKDLASCRRALLPQQANVCGLCHRPIDGEGHLDHNHGYTDVGTPGEIRAVLHPECNRLIGRIENTMRWFKDKQQFWDALDMAYYYTKRESWTGLGHPGPRKGKTKQKRKAKRASKKRS